MNLESIKQMLELPTDDVFQALIKTENIVLWVDWRGEDDDIIKDCESIIQTGSLSAEVIEVDSDGGFELYISYKDGRLKVPLTYSLQDRHITICSLNEILCP